MTMTARLAAARSPPELKKWKKLRTMNRAAVAPTEMDEEKTE